MLWIIPIILGTALILLSVLAERKSLEYDAKLQDFISHADKYDAAVLDAPAEKNAKAVIIQIRIEEQKRTLIHRCTEPFYRKYVRGDRISVYFIEEMPADRALIEGDNRFERFIRRERLLRLPARISGGLMALMGIFLLLI